MSSRGPARQKRRWPRFSVAVLAFAACHHSKAKPEPARVECLVADPDTRHVALDDCADDADCSAGTTCMTEPKGYVPVPDLQEPDLDQCFAGAPGSVCGLSDTRSG